MPRYRLDVAGWCQEDRETGERERYEGRLIQQYEPKHFFAGNVCGDWPYVDAETKEDAVAVVIDAFKGPCRRTGLFPDVYITKTEDETEGMDEDEARDHLIRTTLAKVAAGQTPEEAADEFYRLSRQIELDILDGKF